MLMGLVTGARVELPPFDDFLYDMAYPSLLSPPASLLGLVFLLFLALLVDVFGIVDHILREHQSGDVQQSDGLQFDVQAF